MTQTISYQFLPETSIDFKSVDTEIGLLSNVSFRSQNVEYHCSITVLPLSR